MNLTNIHIYRFNLIISFLTGAAKWFIFFCKILQIGIFCLYINTTGIFLSLKMLLFREINHDAHQQLNFNKQKN